MSGPAELAVATGVLVDAGLKATVLLGCGWAATRLAARSSAAQRHAIWASTFGALPLLVAFAWLRGPQVALDAPWLLALWALGCVGFALPIARGLVALELLRRRATPDPSHPGLFRSSHISGPITWGLWRPVILMPTSAATWPSAHREAAIAHERAHIARRDWAVDLIASTLLAVFWFHPLVWLARRELAREAEHAADDAVLALGALPSDYAGLLLSMARPNAPRVALAVGSTLVATRVRAVLDERCRSARRWPAWVLALALAVLVSPALGAWPTWSAPEQALTCDPGPLP